jgi:hypothetical protein
MIWRAHNKFYRRYGLQDGTTMLINAALLLLELFFLKRPLPSGGNFSLSR